MLIRNSDSIDAAWLEETLRANGALVSGSIRSIATEANAFAGVVGTLASIRVEYDADARGLLPEQLLLKTSKEGLEQELLDLGEREVVFYQAMRDSSAWGHSIPHCYDAAYDRQSGHSHLLLDDLSRTHHHIALPLAPSPTQAHRLMQSLATVHAFFWNRAELGREIGARPDADDLAQRTQRLRDSAPAFLEFLGDALLPKQRQIYEDILESDFLQRQIERLLAMRNLTIVHGDTHTGNFLLPADDGPVVLIDWQRWDINIGTNDLAFLMANQWTPPRRAALERELVEHYYRCLVENGVTDYSWPDCWRDYRGSVVLSTLIPIGQFRRQQHPGSYWFGAEFATAAFAELGCAELL